MKRLLFSVVLVLSALFAQAVDLLPGYVVMANNDTVQCKIKGGKFLGRPYYVITIVNQQGEEQSFKAKDKQILGFGFEEKMRFYHYRHVDSEDKLENGFYQLMVNGSKYKLYGRPATIYGGNPTYVLFSPAGEHTIFEPCILCPWKKRLRELLKDDAKALELVEEAPRVNIPKFVADINKA